MNEAKLQPLQTDDNHNNLVPVTPVQEKAKRTRRPKQIEAPLVLKNLNVEAPRELSASEKKRLSRDEAEALLRREWEIESRKVTGVFRDLEVGAGGNLKFSARKYKWDQVEAYDFRDGQTYEVPLWLARHLNENCKWPAYRHNIDPNAKEGEKVKQYIGQYNHRFAFVSSDFIGIMKPEAARLMT